MGEGDQVCEDMEGKWGMGGGVEWYMVLGCIGLSFLVEINSK